MKFLRHFAEQPFIAATGIAALIHSTSALGFIFEGEQPAVENITSLIEFIHFLGWIMPAFLIALTFDIGQISTSYKIQKYGLTKSRGLTFFTLAFATYALQWSYLSLHMPEMIAGAGVLGMHRVVTLQLFGFLQWVIPALLPMSTVLYTFSSDDSAEEMHSDSDTQIISISEITEPTPELVAVNSANEENESDDFLHFADTGDTTNLLWCPNCDYHTGIKESMDAAQRALRVHQSQHCKANVETLHEVIDADYDRQE